MAAVTICHDFGAQENKICHCFHIFFICHEVMGLYAVILVLWMFSFKPALWLSSFTLIKRLFSSSSILPLEWCHLHIWVCWYFSQQSWFQLVIHLPQYFPWCTLHMISIVLHAPVTNFWKHREKYIVISLRDD